MHLAEAGEGEPLVMLHGWPQHWYMWRNQIPALARHYHVICPDLRGFGWSDAPPRGYEKENLATDVLNLLDALDLRRPVKLAGHDWGGWVGFILCAQHPERFERYLALNIPHIWNRADLRGALEIWRFWYQALMASPLVGYRVARWRTYLRAVLTAGSPHRRTADEIAAFVEPLREPARARATVQLYRTFLTREFPKAAQGRYRAYRLTVPTLLLFGKNDLAISKRLLEGYEPYADDMRVEIVEGSGHFIAEDRPELVTERALEFFGVAQARAA
jgi:pimeloyl-ACP methyl ester carboxylesterase